MIAAGKQAKYTFCGQDFVGIQICGGTLSGKPAVLAIDINGSIPKVVVKIAESESQVRCFAFEVSGETTGAAYLARVDHYKEFRSFLVPELLNGLNSRLLMVQHR